MPKHSFNTYGSKDNIYERTRFLKNEEEIDINKVTNFYEVSQIKHYQDILSSYGFFDHVLTDGGLVWDFLNTTLDNLRAVDNFNWLKEKEEIR